MEEVEVSREKIKEILSLPDEPENSRLETEEYEKFKEQINQLEIIEINPRELLSNNSNDNKQTE